MSEASLSERVRGLVSQWLKVDWIPESRAEIKGLAAAGDEKELEKRLGKRIFFSTAGLRGRMEAGFASMNHVTIAQATQGLCVYLEQVDTLKLKEKGVAIGYDARYHSREYAFLAAALFLHRGVPVYLFRDICPTPYVPYAIHHYGCVAGVMVTASHNPKQDNGYKVYWGDTTQIIPPHDERIAECIEQNLSLWTTEAPEESVLGHSLYRDPTTEVRDSYMHEVKEELSFRADKNKTIDPSSPKIPKITYTAMHGVGAEPVRLVFEEFGLPPYFPVTSQVEPDPEFPTASFPNPEEKGALRLAMKKAEEIGSPVIIANDPDADRLAAAEIDPATGEWKTLNGNEIALLFCDWIWQHMKKRPGADPSNHFVVASTVSSKVLRGMAEQEGFEFHETLTGFKWIGSKAVQLVKERSLDFIFGYEVEIGFLAGNSGFDKDGVRMAAVFAELIYDLYEQGSTLTQKVHELYARLGFYKMINSYYFCYDPEVMTRIFARLRGSGNGSCRSDYPEKIGGYTVTNVRDLTTGFDSSFPDGKARLPTSSSSHMITFQFENGATFTMRGSGTEPKLKYYVEVMDHDEAKAEAVLIEMANALVKDAMQPELNGLVAPEIH